jgi:Transposase IS4
MSQQEKKLLEKYGEFPPNFWGEFVGETVFIACSSWDTDFALNTSGPEYKNRTTKGEIKDFTIGRGRKFPMFQIFFEETGVLYNKLDIEYVLKYSRDVKPQYAGLEVYTYELAKASCLSSLNKRMDAIRVTEENINEDTHDISQHLNSAICVDDNFNGGSESQRSKRTADTLDSGPGVSRKRKTNFTAESVVIDENDMFLNSDVEEDIEEGTEYGMQFEEVHEASDSEPETSDASDWKFGVPPVFGDREFKGSTQHRHNISPENGLPFQYFSRFIPIWMWSKIGTYTNLKANLFYESNKEKGGGRRWYPTAGAEIKAWFASIIWWCIIRSFTFESFFNSDMDPLRVRRWFSNFTRWEQIKRFLKLSDPTKDPSNTFDRLFKVKEIFMTFIEACRTNFWPGKNIALDEALKKFKGRCSFMV